MSKQDNSQSQKNKIRRKLSLPTNDSTTYSFKNKDYSHIPPERFYTVQEEETLRFYQTPKALFKILYAKIFLLDQNSVFHFKRKAGHVH